MNRLIKSLRKKRIHIAEKIIATLISNVLWNFIKFAGLILLRGYTSTVHGVSRGVEVIRKVLGVSLKYERRF